MITVPWFISIYQFYNVTFWDYVMLRNVYVRPSNSVLATLVRKVKEIRNMRETGIKDHCIYQRTSNGSCPGIYHEPGYMLAITRNGPKSLLWAADGYGLRHQKSIKGAQVPGNGRLRSAAVPSTSPGEERNKQAEDNKQWKWGTSDGRNLPPHR